MGIRVVADPPDHEAGEVVHETSCLRLDAQQLLLSRRTTSARSVASLMTALPEAMRL